MPEALDTHSIGIAVLGGGLAVIGWLLSHLIRRVEGKVEGVADVQQVHGERLVRVETTMDGIVTRVDGLESRERSEGSGSWRLPKGPKPNR